MTDRTAALRALIEAVEAGDEHCVDVESGNMASEARDGGGFWPSHDVGKAFRGSLDAAKALHDALLPGSDWHITSSGTVIIDGPEETTAVVGHAIVTDPARAWLLAVLRAYLSQQEAA